MEGPSRVPVAITIAGSDSGGGAGIQADLKAFARCGVHGTSAIVALTAQNTREVISVETIPRPMILDQVRAVASDLGVDAVKIGMLFDQPTVESVAEALDEVGEVPIVVDPVMVAESGAVLLDPAAKEALVELILSRAAVATPNLGEARELSGLGESATSDDLARAVRELGPRAVVVTGGHTADGADVFFDGETLESIEGPAVPGRSIARLRLHPLVGARGPPRPWLSAAAGGARGAGDRRRGCRKRPPRAWWRHRPGRRPWGARTSGRAGPSARAAIISP